MPRFVTALINRLRLGWVFSAIFALILATSASAQNTPSFQLSLDDARVAARQAALSGRFELARDFALALVDADENDRDALLVLAAVQPQLGEAREGRRAGVRAYRLSDTEEQRFEAARLTALAAANEERYTLSQFWLRRAAVNAPNEAAFTQTQTDYRGIRALNRLSFNLGFSVTPSNNVNGGTEAEYFIIDGITFADGTPLYGTFDGPSRALPGTTALIDVRLAYALSRTADSQTSVTARAYGRAVWLNGEGRAISPGSRNSDFASQFVEVSLDHAIRLGDATLSAQALVGSSWFGGELNREYLRGRLAYSMPLSDRTSVTWIGVLDEIRDYNGAPRTNHARTASARVSHVLANGNRIVGALAIGGQSSVQPNDRFETATAQINYAWTDPIGPVQLSLGAGVTYTDYRDFSVLVPTPGGRQDTRVFANVSATFPDINYAGFVPVMTLSVQDTQSNVSRFQRNEYSLNIGVRSSF